MNILVLNQNWFVHELRSLGHRVITFGHSGPFDVLQPKQICSWAEVLKQLPSDFNPDLVVIHDDSSPILITELETIVPPTYFYSVDTHHHLNFHRYLAKVFTHTFVAQRDYICKFEEFGINAHWLPLWASSPMEASSRKEYAAVFVGTLDARLNAERVHFFEKLKSLVPIEVKSGRYEDIFPFSQIVVNQTVKGDLNFRVFEALLSGALLITERIENGINELFEEGKELVLYARGNTEEVAEKIRYYLQNQSEASEIAAKGREKVLKRHLGANRVQSIVSLLDSPTRPGNSPDCFAAMRNFICLAAALARQGDPQYRIQSLFEVLRLAEVGFKKQEVLDERGAMDLIKAILALQPLLSPEKIYTILTEFTKAYPTLIVFPLVHLEFLTAAGFREEARTIASQVTDIPYEEVLRQATIIVSDLRQ